MLRQTATEAIRIAICALFVASMIGSADAGTIASRVLGQPDFVHGAANTVDAASLALSAGSNQHIGVAVDSAGHLYVADLTNNRVLGWHSVSALVSGVPADLVIGQTDFETGFAAATTNASTLAGPRGVAVDASGNVYVADTQDSRVLIFPNPFTTMSQTGQNSGFVATVVIGQVGDFTSHACNVGGSSPSADTLCFPEDVALDSGGNLYIADNANNRVVEYDGPIIASPIAANRVFGQLGSFITNVANVGGSISKNGLKLPTGVAVDKNNNLYVADFSNSRVLEFNTPRTVTMIAGSGDTSADEVWGQGGSFTTGSCGSTSTTSLCFPLRVALDASANLYIADTSSQRVLEYTESTNPPANLAATHIFGQTTATASTCNQSSNTPSASTLCGPSGLALDSSGDLFIADGNNNRVLKYITPLTTDLVADVALGEPDFAHTNETIDPASLSTPDQLALDPVSGGIVVADNVNNRILGWRHAAMFTTGEPADLVIGQADFYSGQINRTGGSPSANTLSMPSGVAFDSNGNLYIADTDNSRVVEYNAPFAACAGVFPCVGGSPNLIIGQSSPTVSTCNQVFSDPPSASTLCQPTQVALDSFGNLYVADAGNNRVVEYNTPLSATAVTGSGDTTADLVFGQGATGTGAEFTTGNCNRALTALTATSMCDPLGVGVDPNNNVYVSDTTNARILEFNETVNATTAPANVTANAVFGQNGSFTNNFQLVPGANSLFLPNGVSFDAAGDLFAADQGDARVLEFFTPFAVTATAGSGDTIADVVWGQGGDLFVAHCDASAPAPSAATLCGPASAVVDSAGNVYISDTGNSRITAYAPPFPPPGSDIGDDSPGVLDIEPATVKFAATRVGKHRTHTVTLTNNGSVPITLGRLNAIGDFTFMSTCPTQLAPAASCDIRITFAPIAGGRRGGVIAIGDDAHANPHQIDLFGRAKRRGAQ
jgi:sugar lactone lactonase YvrE